MIIPQCFGCKHLRPPGESPGSPMTCAAYDDPEMGIPDAILRNDFDHRDPYYGDDGVRFEEGDPGSDDTPPSG